MFYEQTVVYWPVTMTTNNCKTAEMLWGQWKQKRQTLCLAGFNRYYLNIAYISNMILDRWPSSWAAVVINYCHISLFFLLSNKSNSVKIKAVMKYSRTKNRSGKQLCDCCNAGGGRPHEGILVSLLQLWSSGWTGPTGGLAGLTGPVRSQPVMADCMPPLLLEACVVLGASEDKLACVHQVSSRQDDLEIVMLTILQEQSCSSTGEGNDGRLQIGAVLCPLREH